MEFLFPKIDDTGMAGMSAGSILQNKFFLRRWWLQGMGAAGRWFISHPGFQEYLIGERTPGAIAKGAQSTSMQVARLFMTQAMGEDTDMPDEPQNAQAQ